MKTIKRTLAALAVVSGLAVAGTANATLTNWYLDTDGAGIIAPTLIADYVDLTGTSYVHNTFSSPTAFAFNEAGHFIVLSADGTTLLTPSLTADFLASGTGTTGGLLSFTPGGTLSVFSGASVDIGDFILQSGSANLAANSTLPNGTVSLIFQATNLASGYFFDSSMTDLSTLVSGGLVFGFATTNVISLANGTRTVDPLLLAAYNISFNPDVVGPIVANNTTDLYLSNNGQFRVSVVSVPEPGSLALIGLGLVGLATSLRRRNV